jgi:hypothetical protein
VGIGIKLTRLDSASAGAQSGSWVAVNSMTGRNIVPHRQIVNYVLMTFSVYSCGENWLG